MWVGQFVCFACSIEDIHPPEFITVKRQHTKQDPRPNKLLTLPRFFLFFVLAEIVHRQLSIQH